MSEASTGPSSDVLLPHRGPALLLERVLEWGDDQLECVGRIPLDSPFASRGAAECLVGIELAAQAAAALEALCRRRDLPARPEIGYIVGIREARFESAGIPVDRELLARVRLLGGAAALASYEVDLHQGAVRCLSAQISTYRSAGAALKDGR